MSNGEMSDEYEDGGKWGRRRLTKAEAKARQEQMGRLDRALSPEAALPRSDRRKRQAIKSKLVRTRKVGLHNFKTIDIMDFRRLAPALAAHEAEWISSGKLRECIARWMQGADFSDKKEREWEGAVPELTVKEEMLELLEESSEDIETNHSFSETCCDDAKKEHKDGERDSPKCDVQLLLDRIEAMVKRCKGV